LRHVVALNAHVVVLKAITAPLAPADFKVGYANLRHVLALSADEKRVCKRVRVPARARRTSQKYNIRGHWHHLSSFNPAADAGLYD
jgi:hypothetical protein